jgi:hypothetical protein
MIPITFRLRKTFISFVYSLVDYYKTAKDDRNEWENDTIDTYLSALAGWVGDMEGAYQFKGEEVPQDVNWNLIARMLAAATIYE